MPFWGWPTDYNILVFFYFCLLTPVTLWHSSLTISHVYIIIMDILLFLGVLCIGIL